MAVKMPTLIARNLTLVLIIAFASADCVVASFAGSRWDHVFTFCAFILAASAVATFIAPVTHRQWLQASLRKRMPAIRRHQRALVIWVEELQKTAAKRLLLGSLVTILIGASLVLMPSHSSCRPMGLTGGIGFVALFWLPMGVWHCLFAWRRRSFWIGALYFFLGLMPLPLGFLTLLLICYLKDLTLSP